MSQHTSAAWSGNDFRIICSCQLHARRERTVWKKTLRVASRGAALLVSIPLAFAAMDLPIEATNLNLSALRQGELRNAMQQSKSTALPEAKLEPAERELPIFTTPTVREQFLAPVTETDASLETFKQQYFRRHVPYGSIIYREALKNNLPPELVAAMVHTESDFRPLLVSHKSAQGLMQIVPETARLLGIADPFDPEENIAAGTKYFRYLLNRFDGDEMTALAAYNAGEGNVVRFGGIPPFAETRSYVQKVHSRAARYRQRMHNRYIAAGTSLQKLQ